MVHRDPTFAGRTRRLCASATAGINGRSSPSRANRIRKYRKPSTGSRFRKTERNGTSDGAWGWPYPHGAPDADGGALLSLIAGVACVLAAKVTLSFILHFVPASVPRLAEVGVDRTVLLFALLLSIFTGIIFGLAPAFQAMKADMTAAIREGAQGSGYR